jgi:predicted TIM-barrel enzyme
MIEGVAARLIRERNRLGADSVAILADIQVKHARTLSTRSIALSIEEATGRGGADGVIVTGSTTGRSPEKTDLEDAISGASHSRVPLFIGSGLDADGVKGLPFDSDIRLIVGSSIRKGGHAGAPLDPKRIAGFMKAVKARTRRKNAKTRRLSS